MKRIKKREEIIMSVYSQAENIKANDKKSLTKPMKEFSYILFKFVISLISIFIFILSFW